MQVLLKRHESLIFDRLGTSVDIAEANGQAFLDLAAAERLWQVCLSRETPPPPLLKHAAAQTRLPEGCSVWPENDTDAVRRILRRLHAPPDGEVDADWFWSEGWTGIKGSNPGGNVLVRRSFENGWLTLDIPLTQFTGDLEHARRVCVAAADCCLSPFLDAECEEMPDSPVFDEILIGTVVSQQFAVQLHAAASPNAAGGKGLVWLLLFFPDEDVIAAMVANEPA